MKKDFAKLPIRIGKFYKERIPLPLKATTEERREMWICPMMGYSLSLYGCYQCIHFEVHSQRVADVAKESGHCMFPRNASRQSQDITTLFSGKVKGDLAVDATLEDVQEYRRQLGIKKRKKGGMHSKVDSIVRALEAEKSKKFIFRGMKNRYPDMSDAYLTTLWYQARKVLREKSAE